MHVLIVKRGALGDVVRTSYFAEALKRKHAGKIRISWITAPAATSLIRFNPHIDDLWTFFDQARSYRFDRIWSLDDEVDALEGVACLDAKRVSGAYLDPCGKSVYSGDVAAWFDMGLLSRFGKKKADALKKKNQCTHGEIFSKIFEVDSPVPRFYGERRIEADARLWLGDDAWHLGINPFAGGRWPSKELPLAELKTLLRHLLLCMHGLQRPLDVVLLGAGRDRVRNQDMADDIGDPRIRVADTDESPLHLGAVVRGLNCLITSDSLAMHLAASQGIPFIAFFAPTSAAEIDDFGIGVKLSSTASDYCSYRKNTDNSSITAERLAAVLAPILQLPAPSKLRSTALLNSKSSFL